MPGPLLKSCVAIAKLLSAEGFTPHIANMIERYWKHSAGLTQRQRRQIESIEREISAWCTDMAPSKKLLLGRFIGLHKKMSFDAGLRIGLTAFTIKNARDVPDDSAADEINRMSATDQQLADIVPPEET